MWWKLVLAVLGAAMLGLVAVVVSGFPLGFAIAMYASTLPNPVQWAERQLTIMRVRGGPEIVLEIDADTERRLTNESLRREVVGILRKARLTFNTRLVHEGVEVSVDNDEQLPGVLSHVRTGFTGFRIGTRQTSERTALVGFSDEGHASRARQAAEKSQGPITSRLTDLGLNVIVTVQPPESGPRLLIQMARTDDPKRVIDIATKPGEIGFRLIDHSMAPEKALASVPPANTDILYGADSGRPPYLVEKRVIVRGADLTDVQPGFDQRTNEPIVHFRLSVGGARKFAQATEENVGRAFAIVVDGEVLSAPIIREPITGGYGQISGNFTVQSARDLAAVLRYGELPTRLKVVEQRPAK